MERLKNNLRKVDPTSIPILKNHAIVQSSIEFDSATNNEENTKKMQGKQHGKLVRKIAAASDHLKFDIAFTVKEQSRKKQMNNSKIVIGNGFNDPLAGET